MYERCESGVSSKVMKPFHACFLMKSPNQCCAACSVHWWLFCVASVRDDNKRLRAQDKNIACRVHSRMHHRCCITTLRTASVARRHHSWHAEQRRCLCRLARKPCAWPMPSLRGLGVLRQFLLGVGISISVSRGVCGLFKCSQRSRVCNPSGQNGMVGGRDFGNNGRCHTPLFASECLPLAVGLGNSLLVHTAEHMLPACT